MAIFSWANPKAIEIPGALASDRPLYIISDLHLGDGTRSDAFMGKDQQLLAFLRKVQSEGAHLVINGDALDFHQAWTFTRILRAHSELLGELSRMAETTGVTYIWGNQDQAISVHVDNPDALFTRATSAGAAVVLPLATTPYGARHF